MRGGDQFIYGSRPRNLSRVHVNRTVNAPWLGTCHSLLIVARWSGVVQVSFRFCRPATPLSTGQQRGQVWQQTAGAGDAVEGCVLGGYVGPALTREFGHVKPGGPPVSE